MKNFFAVLCLFMLLSIGFPSCQSAKYKEKVKKEYLDKYIKKTPKERRW